MTPRKKRRKENRDGCYGYNKRYTLNLIEKGYQFSDKEEKILAARKALGIAEPSRT